MTPAAASGLSADREFERLFLEHYPRLVRTLLRLVGNSGQAEELAADAFYRLHQHRAKAAPTKTWRDGSIALLSISGSTHCARMPAAAAAKQQAQRESAGNETPGNPLYELLAEEQRERVRNVICRLKPVQGQVLLMGSSGFTCKEIAALLGVKPDSLYVLISRAKAQFEKEYVSLYGRAE